MIRCRIGREWVPPVATANFDGGMQNLHCGLTLEDEFVLTRIRAKAKSLNNRSDRDQFFWVMILKLVCKERAYKTVMNQIGVTVETNVQMFDDSEDSVE
jgi:hypothetical protein